jgi:ketosteroid isomerase-like protein
MRLSPVSLLLVGASCAVLSACTPKLATPTVDVAAVELAVKTDANQLIADLNARDAVKAVSHDAADIVNMQHGAANYVGIDADLAMTKQIVSDPNIKLVVSNEVVDVAASGDLAVYRSTYTYIFTKPGTQEATTETGNFLLGYKKQADGKLKLAWTMLSDTPAAAPAAAK